MALSQLFINQKQWMVEIEQNVFTDAVSIYHPTAGDGRDSPAGLPLLEYQKTSYAER
ncbi:hypothetical protein [Geitlerinema sp. PCC 9228]|jgi:hypothetical protein|uniref:hypothetical protein n=1 Tax=Geitlerinema sp. PCC 9228 TaxID=111611 RepID=UPI00147A43FB|nr:hypothetical protein [Geitlerinema sp. PCC 9228]